MKPKKNLKFTNSWNDSRSHMQSMQQMNSMVNSMFADFGMMGPPMIGHGQNSRMLPMGGMQMMPFGFAPMAPSFGNMFSSMVSLS